MYRPRVSTKNKRTFKTWNRERIFPNALEAEKAVLDEGCWTYRFKNHTYEGIKKYYECKFKKYKRCLQQIHLMFLTNSQEVHLFRTNHRHNHHMVGEQLRPVSMIVPPLLRQIAQHEPQDAQDITFRPNLAIVKAETLEEPFEESNQDDFLMDVSPSESFAENELGSKRQKRNWIREETFACQREACEFVRQEGCWGYRFSNTTLDGVKNYFRCNLTRTKGKQCAQEIYLAFEKNSPLVHLYRTNCDHTHDSINEEFRSSSAPGTSHAHHNAEFTPIKVEISDSSSEDASFQEGLNIFDIDAVTQALFVPQMDTVAPQMHSMRSKSICQKSWAKERTFSCAESAERVLKEEACWSYRFKNNTSEGAKKYFRCNLARRRGTQCAQEVHLLYEANSPRVHLFRTTSEHTHDVNEAQGINMDPLVRDEISMLYRHNVRKPKDIWQMLQKKPRQKLPSLRQISSFVIRLKKKHDISHTSANSFEDVVIKSEPEEYIQLFSSGDLSSECEDGGEVKEAPPGARPPPLQQQPLPTGGPPNIPPPPGENSWH
ncbi:uncharacterized protein LOC132257433 [Phlebotomus argentipes]|uniref:uncharacterized protein LOC132257433 n=1 Tax=Phlebotomus argentipes TaxID=94469 RepID=UPI00289352BA|nr:uncharacterized protein LOC132257433 [Phlebotomus argentipes]XP_059610306.1 uncharacterized protein LOC132257433 [Phlebotomus argentipes]